MTKPPRAAKKRRARCPHDSFYIMGMGMVTTVLLLRCRGCDEYATAVELKVLPRKAAKRRKKGTK